MLPCNVQKWRGNEHTLAVCLHIIIYRLSHAWGDGHGQIHFPKVQRCSRFLAHSTRPRNAGACSASLIGLLQHTTAPPFHCAAQHNRHMRRDLAVLAPAHGSSPHFPPSSCSLLSASNTRHTSTHTPLLSPVPSLSHRPSRHCLASSKGLRSRTVPAGCRPRTYKARQCPSRVQK